MITTKTQWIDCTNPKCPGEGWWGTWERKTKIVICPHCGKEVER